MRVIVASVEVGTDPPVRPAPPAALSTNTFVPCACGRSPLPLHLPVPLAFPVPIPLPVPLPSPPDYLCNVPQLAYAAAVSPCSATTSLRDWFKVNPLPLPYLCGVVSGGGMTEAQGW